MAIFNPPSSTATVAQNTNSVAISQWDLTPVQPGMLLYLGARDRKKGDGLLIADKTVSADKTSGTLILIGSVDTAYTNAPWLIDTGSYSGSGDVLKVDAAFDLLNAFTSFTSKNSTLYGGNRILALDKALASNVSQLAFMIGGRDWGRIEQRTFAYTPTGGATATVETLALRALPDGTSLVDSIHVDLSTGGVDVLADSATMVAASLTDLGSARKKKVTITGTTPITSFGPGKHLERLITFQDAGLVLTHNATSLKLPGSANITTQAGDTCHATSDPSGNWHVRSYQRASGAPLGLIPGPSTAFSPAINSALGSITTLGTVTASYKMVTEKLCFVRYSIPITSNGNASGAVNASLPFAAAGIAYLAGRESAATGKALIGQTGGPTVVIFDTANNYPGGSGYTLNVSGIYEIA